MTKCVFYSGVSRRRHRVLPAQPRDTPYGSRDKWQNKTHILSFNPVTIVRPSRFWGCGAHRVSIAEKAPAKCACEGNRVGRHVILPIFDVPSHSVRRTPSELRAKNGSILRFSAYVMRDSRYVKRLMYRLSHTSVGRQMNNGKNRVPSHRNGVRPATIGAEGTTCRPGGPRDPA